MKAHTRDGKQAPGRSWRRFFTLSAVALLALAVIVPSAEAKRTTTGSISFEGGLQFTNSVTVTIYSSVSSATQMQFRNAGGIWSGWEPYSTVKTWTLPAGDGLKTVEAQYKSVGKALSKSDTITLDTVAPATTSDYDGLPHLNFGVALTATDGLSGVLTTEYRIDGGMWQTGTTVQIRLGIRHKRPGLSRGTHVIEFCSTDNADNVESPQSVTVTVGT